MNNTVLSEQVAVNASSHIKEKEKSSSQNSQLINKFIRIITFVDLPIRKKFLLFSLGVLFWFLVMFVISVAANIDVNNKTSRIVEELIPVDRTIQKITLKLQGLRTDAADIANITNAYVLDQKVNVSKARIIDIRSFVASLLAGGEISDISRDDSRLIESFSVSAMDRNVQATGYINELKKLVEQSELMLSGIADLKSGILLNHAVDDGQMASALSEYRQILASAISLSSNYSVQLSKSYEENSKKIENATKVTFYTFIGVLFLATFLLVIFTSSISDSIIAPVQAIADEIKSLGAGKIDLSNHIVVRSKDEIGQLSEDFNVLTREIHDIVTFKKVIEEDHNLEDVYARMGRAFNDKCGLREFTIYEVSRSQNNMKAVYPIILNDKELACSEAILSDCNLCKVKKTGHTISSLTYDEICREFRPELDKVHICFPMVVGGKTGGVVQFLFDSKDTIYRNNERLFKAEQYIKESLSVIEAKRLTNTLRESALKDPLTGLYNRRFLQEYTETLVAGVIRRERNVGLIMCDLDYFKQVNDTHGHNVGDSLLIDTSSNILKCVRAADLVIRFGGEEFLVLLLDINEGDTIKVAEKIRETFENTKFKIPDGTIKKTISLGVSEFPVDTKSFWQSIKFADVALYKAKEAGRNKSVRFTEDMWSKDEF